MYPESDLLPLSALQHLVFCERQWALIHLEGLWEENRLTVEGRLFHQRVDEYETEVRGDLRTVRGLRLRSLRLGLVGKADVVEFRRLSEETASGSGVRLEGVPGLWQPVPVEYKRGRPKPDRCDEVQVCAQALCLEEMLGVAIPGGVLFYGQPHRRYEVGFDEALRTETEGLAARLHGLTEEARTPPARFEKKCNNCSLVSVCLPQSMGNPRSTREYLDGLFNGLPR
jgi:CRISPR-associated exonuclease Cas4